MRNIFVFGSNLAGRHGRGSAAEAMRNHGAIYGVGVGFQGMSYAIPTKDCNLKILPIETISKYVDQFELFALANINNYIFDVVAIGCGLSGYKPEQIAPLFKYRPCNVLLPVEFMK